MKTSNEYATAIPADLYAKTPKAVFAALALSYACRGAGEELLPDEAVEGLLVEWEALHDAGIVPQAPPRRSS